MMPKFEAYLKSQISEDPTLYSTLKKSIVFDRNHLNQDQEVLIQSSQLSQPSQSSHDDLHTLFGLKPNQIALKSLKNQSLASSDSQSANFDFELVHQLGKGGMGVVYEGIQKSLNRAIAIKQSNANAQYFAQIYHEAQITAFLDHPNILPVYDFAIDREGHPIQIMKKIDGVNWAQILDNPHHDFWHELEVSPLPEDRLLFNLDILLKVSQAVAYAHQKKVIHRDLKPENIMIGKFGEVYVLDWGIALYIGDPASSPFLAQKEANLEQALVGTPAYMAPEMAEITDKKVHTTATDVYLLGAILYELIHHDPLHHGDDIQSILRNIRENRLPIFASDLNIELKSLLEMSLKSSPSHRPQNAGVFRKILQQVVSSFQSRQLEKKAFMHLEDMIKGLRVENEMGIKTLNQSIFVRQEEQALYDQLNDHFDEGRHYFRSSLEIYPHNQEATKGFQKLLTLWIRRCVKREDFQLAQKYLRELPQFDTKLDVEIAQGKQKFEKVQQEIKALKDWHENESFQISSKPRLYLALFGLIFLGIGSMLVYILSQKGIYQDTAKGRAIAVVVLSSMMMISAEIWLHFKAQKQQINQAFMRFKQLMYVILISVILSRLIGWQYHQNHEIMLLHEMPMLFMASLTVSIMTDRKDFLWGGLAFFVVSLMSLWRHEYLLLFYALAQFILWAVVLIRWKFDQLQVDHHKERNDRL
jgi:serine/threonine protein kinase